MVDDNDINWDEFNPDHMVALLAFQQQQFTGRLFPLDPPAQVPDDDQLPGMFGNRKYFSN